MKFSKLLLILPCILVGFDKTSAYQILTIFLISGRSNMNYFDSIHLELAKKGHQITVISPTPSLVTHENIKEIPGLDFSKLVTGMMTKPNFFENRLSGDRMSTPFYTMATKFGQDCDLFHQLPQVQQLIQKGSGQYDLVMTMAFMNECVYGIFHHMNTSSVIISTVPVFPWFAAATGSPTPLSIIPHIYFSGDQQMTFWERLENVLSYTFQMVTRNYIYLPKIEQAYQKYIPNAPKVNEVKKNVSLMLGAGHPSFGPIRPSMPDLIDDIGGIHCRPAEPLPKNIQEMITDPVSGKEENFIFFSLGSVVQGHHVPEYIKQVIVKTFAKFPEYKVLWKWEADSLEVDQLPENVRVSKWFPQQDVLGHPKCKLFITHGGLSSLHETIYHGVPVIGIPFFGDQDWNMEQVEYHGIGVKLDLKDISEEKFTKLVEKVLYDKK